MILTDAEFFKSALNNYDNPFTVSVEEFSADLKRFSHLNTLFRRYSKNSEDLKDRLIMNHIVILCNCFTVATSIELMRYKIGGAFRVILDTFMFYMGLVASVERLNFELLEYLEVSHGRKQAS